MSGPEELRALVEEMRALAKRHVNLVKTGAAYAAGELRGASTSTFEIYIGHFREIGKEIEAALTRAESSLASPAGMEGWMPTHRHKKRGSEYEVIGVGKMQAEHWIDQRWTRQPESGEPPKPSWSRVDLREVVVYRSLDDGSLWVRPREEFEDGRFEALRSLEGRDE